MTTSNAAQSFINVGERISPSPLGPSPRRSGFGRTGGERAGVRGWALGFVFEPRRSAHGCSMATKLRFDPTLVSYHSSLRRYSPLTLTLSPRGEGISAAMRN